MRIYNPIGLARLHGSPVPQVLWKVGEQRHRGVG